MKYLKYFKTDADCQNYFSSDEFVTPNVSYTEDADIVYFKPIKSANSTIYATYSATDDNKLAIANTSNVKSLKVNGNSVPFDNAYYFESNGEHKVEIELIDDSVINGLIFDENYNVLSYPMFFDLQNQTGPCLTSITIPDSVTSIGVFAFAGCSGLTSITIPNSVTSIGVAAFEGCDSLPVEDNLRYADTYLIGAVDRTLSTYTIKEGTKWIGTEAFRSCSGLTSINIPDSVTSIGDSAFDSCSGLTSINIPNLVTYIGGNAFSDCYSLTSINIPDGVTSIRDGVFSDCKGLTSISIPDSVTSIGNLAFYFCDSLTSITIPDSVTSIGDNAFYDCRSLTSITIGNSVTSIGDSAFYSCHSLISITIPDSVTSIGDSAFYYCDSLTSITIGNSVASIGKSAFERCTGFTSIIIPASVTSIAQYAFANCYSLNEITCLATTAPSIISNTFNNIPRSGTLRYPSGSDYSSWLKGGYLEWASEEI